MPILRSLFALLFLGATAANAANAQDLEPLVSRPLTLPRGTFDVTLHGTYTNSTLFGASTDGETVAAGVDYGAADNTELGMALAFPVNPGASFGSILGSVAVVGGKNVAVRLDAGYERIGANGDVAVANGHTDRYFGGIGARIRAPITSTVAFVTGRVGAVHFGHFNNFGQSGVGLYLGASALTQLASDFLVFSGGNNNSSTNIGINLPAGLLLQPDPHLALTLQAGYSVVIESGNGRTISAHYIPLALEAVVSPAQPVDIGVRFSIDGLVGVTGGSSGPGYFDTRVLMFWLRFHA